MAIAEKMTELFEQITTADKDAKKFDDGNKAAGTRVRKAMQEIKRIAQEIRETVSEMKNADNYTDND